MKPKELQENLDLAQQTLGQWLRYRQFFRKGTSDEPISSQEEQEFLETTSAIAQNLRKLGQRIDEKKFPFRKNEIAAQLKSTMSIGQFRNMAEPDRKKFYKEWHISLLHLTRTVGALKFMTEGYRPKEPAVGGKKGGGGKLPTGKVVVAVVVVAVLALIGLGIKVLIL